MKNCKGIKGKYPVALSMKLQNSLYLAKILWDLRYSFSCRVKTRTRMVRNPSRY